MLDTQHAGLACTVLAGLGPAATAAQARLTRLATSDGRDAGTAAWALFRITGDPEPLLAREDVFATGRVPVAPARSLGDLGPLARRHVPGIEWRLTEQPQYWSTWEGVELSYATSGSPATRLCA